MSRFINLRGAGLAAVLGGAVFGSAALTTTASAATQPATLAVDHACYVVTKTLPVITITGSGYMPGDSVSITDKTGSIDTMTTASTTGTIAVAVKAPVPVLSKPGEQADTISAEDFTASGTEIAGTTTTELSTIAVSNSGTKKRPGLQAFTEKTDWSFSGFPTGKTIWGHYTYDGKVIARQAFGKAAGPCGLLKVRKRLYPVTPHHKAYRLQIDSHKTYSKKTEPALRVKLALTFF